MEKFILLSALLFSSLSWSAGSLEVKGQSDSSHAPAALLQTPFSQMTKISDKNFRIETGSDNILPNPNFESSTLGWTTSGGGVGGTITLDTSGFMMGKNSVFITTGTGNEVATSPTITTPQGFATTSAGSNGVFSCHFINGGGAVTITMSVVSGSNVIGSSTFSMPDIGLGSGTPTFQGTTFTFPSGNFTVKITGVTAAQTYAFDNCYVGPNTGVFSLNPNSEAASWTPTVVGAGSATINTCTWQRIGSRMKGDCSITFGTSTATPLTVSLPNGLTIASDYANPTPCGQAQAGINSTTYFGARTLCIPGASTFSFGLQQSTTSYPTVTNGNGIGGAGLVWNFNFDVRIAGWSAQNAISAQTSLQTWSGTTSYASATLTSASYTGFTVTTPAISKINGNNLTCTTTASGAGLQCTPTSAGLYYVCATASLASTAAAGIDMRIIDGGAAIVNAGQQFNQTINSFASFTECGFKLVTSISTNIQFILQGSTTAGTLNIGASMPVNWSVIQLTQSLPGLVMAGNVVQPDPTSPVMKEFFISFWGTGTTPFANNCTTGTCASTTTPPVLSYSGASVSFVASTHFRVSVPSGVCSVTSLQCTGIASNVGTGNATLGPCGTMNATTYDFCASSSNAAGTLHCECQ